MTLQNTETKQAKADALHGVAVRLVASSLDSAVVTQMRSMTKSVSSGDENASVATRSPAIGGPPTKVGAVPQMIPSNRYGIVVPVDDGVALLNALRAALAANWDHQAIAQWGQVRSWSQVADEVLYEAREALAEVRHRG